MHSGSFRGKALEKIFARGGMIVDIGGGLRADPSRNNRYDPTYADAVRTAHYVVLDKEDTYHPDVVGDIHRLPFDDGSVRALLCISVLEHVEDPFLVMREMHRVLEPEGILFLYVPFLFYYHAHDGYYLDYWRFTADGIRVLARPFASCEIVPTRGAIQTLVHLIPGINRYARHFSFLDRWAGKDASRQTAGYEALLRK